MNSLSILSYQHFFNFRDCSRAIDEFGNIIWVCLHVRNNQRQLNWTNKMSWVLNQILCLLELKQVLSFWSTCNIGFSIKYTLKNVYNVPDSHYQRNSFPCSRGHLKKTMSFCIQWTFQLKHVRILFWIDVIIRKMDKKPTNVELHFNVRTTKFSKI